VALYPAFWEGIYRALATEQANLSRGETSYQNLTAFNGKNNLAKTSGCCEPDPYTRAYWREPSNLLGTGAQPPRLPRDARPVEVEPTERESPVLGDHEVPLSETAGTESLAICDVNAVLWLTPQPPDTLILTWLPPTPDFLAFGRAFLPSGALLRGALVRRDVRALFRDGCAAVGNGGF
jgi:hypothetical protein